MRISDWSSDVCSSDLPSVEFDWLAVNSLFKRFIPAAFYYKTFMWPNWHWFEPAIRKAAGLGDAPEGVDPDSYPHRFAHTDILIVGSGASGLARSEVHSSDLPSLMRISFALFCLNKTTSLSLNPIFLHYFISF